MLASVLACAEHNAKIEQLIALDSLSGVGGMSGCGPTGKIKFTPVL